MFSKPICAVSFEPSTNARCHFSLPNSFLGKCAVGGLPPPSAPLAVGRRKVLPRHRRLCLQPPTEELRSVGKSWRAVVIRCSSMLFSVGMLLTFLVGCFCWCLGSLGSCPLNAESTPLVTVTTRSVPYTFPDVLPGEVLPAAERRLL